MVKKNEPDFDKHPEANEQRTFSSELGGGEFYPELPRMDFKELQDTPIVVIDCQLIEDFKSDFGVHDCLLLKIEMNGELFTTISSGEVIIKRVMKAKNEGLLPLQGTISKQSKNYYNIL